MQTGTQLSWKEHGVLFSSSNLFLFFFYINSWGVMKRIFKYKYGVKGISADLVRNWRVQLPKFRVRGVTAELLGKHWIKVAQGTQLHFERSSSGPVRKSFSSCAMFASFCAENLLEN